MLCFLMLLCVLSIEQGKAFPRRNKRSYEGNYDYNPYQGNYGNMVPQYAQNVLPDYQGYRHNYFPQNDYHWSAVYNPPMPYQPIPNAEPQISQHGMKSAHTWHFIDHNRDIPITRYSDARHEELESQVHIPAGRYSVQAHANGIDGLGSEPLNPDNFHYQHPDIYNSKALEIKGIEKETPMEINGLSEKDEPIIYEESYEKPVLVEALVKKTKPVVNEDDEYDIPVVVEALVQKENPMVQEREFPDADALTKKKPVAHFGDYKTSNVDSPTKKEKPVFVEGNSDAYMDEYDLPIVNSLTKKEKPIKEKPIKEKPIKEKPIKEKPIKEKPIKEKPIKEKPIKEKPIKEKPIKEKPIKEKPIKEKPIKEKPIKEKPIKEKPIKEKPIKEKPIKEKPIKEKPIKEKPIKEKPIKEKPIKEKPIKEKPIKEKPIKEKPIKEKPIKEKPIKEKPISYMEEYEHPYVVDSLAHKESLVDSFTKKKKPVKEKPVIKEKPVSYMDEYELPVTVNSINKDKPIAMKEKPAPHKDGYEYVVDSRSKKEKPIAIKQKQESGVKKYSNTVAGDSLMKQWPPGKEDYKLSRDPLVIDGENVGDFEIPAVEALALEQEDLEDGQEMEDFAFNEHNVERDGSKDEESNVRSSESDEDFGSAMELDARSNIAGTSGAFFPIDPKIMSLMTRIQDQERLKYKSCITQKNETGNCMPIQLCSVSSLTSNIDELVQNVCVIDEVFIGICCPEFPVETVKVDWGHSPQPNEDSFNDENLSQNENECGKLPFTIKDQDPWPWMALLVALSSDKIFCGGALITENYVLTAAHCTTRIPRNQILVRLSSPSSGNSSEANFEVVEIKRHAGYNPRTMQNDIALLKLSGRVQLGHFRSLVCLTEDTEDFLDESATLLRWKGTSEIGDGESISVISNEECQHRMNVVIVDSILCAEPRTEETMCNADSGAPLILSKDERFTVIGVLTWNRNDCDGRFPTLFTRVSSYQRWIRKHAS